MRVEIFSLCDAATADAGKLNVLGAFDTIWAATTPVVYPQCSIALRVRFDHIEQGDHRVVVNFVDVDGKHVIPAVNGTIHLSFSGEQRSGSANLIFNFQRLRFDHYGEYSIDLAIDGRNEAALPLYLMERTVSP